MKQDQAWSADIRQMHHKFEVHKWMDDASPEMRKECIKFRMELLSEEFNETMKAYFAGDAEEMVDGLIDLCVVAIGTLDLAEVNTQEAWDEVLFANMTKQVGEKPERPNPLGLPDLVKPLGWEAPQHYDNLGILEEIIS